MRTYSVVDLLRFRRFASENPDLKPVALVKAYNEKYLELTNDQKLKNLAKALNITYDELISMGRRVK